MNQEFMMGTDSFGTIQREPPVNNDFNKAGGGQKADDSFKQIEVINEAVSGAEGANEESASKGEKSQIVGSLSDKLNNSQNQKSFDNQQQEKNSFSDLSMAAANPNNKGLTAVGQGLQPDNLMGSFGSIPTQQRTNELNQTKGKQSAQATDPAATNNSNNINYDNKIGENAEQKTGEKPKNKHHAKPRNKSGHKSQNKTKSIGHYRIGKTIGEGTFGKVKLGVHNITGEKVAVKILEKHKIIEDVDVERVSREIKILKLARHPNVIQLYEIIETPKQLYLITEYVSKGELFDYIVKKQRLEEAEACKFFQQIISGIQYLKELGIVHRDMKPENLLLDQNGQIKLVDFGLSNTYEPGQTLKTACGSPCYAAPEMIAGKEYHGAQVDVWSCGVILFAMVCGYLPFEDPDTNKLYKKILDGKFEIPTWVSESCSDLMNKILENNPEKRLDTDQIMKHEWYTSMNKPVIKNTGLIIGKNKIPLEPQLVKMLKKYGFEQADAEKSLNQNKHNQVTTIYYLLHKRYVNDGKLPSNFNADQTIRINSPTMEQQNAQKSDKKAKEKEENAYSPVKKINVVNEVSQKSLARSPRSPMLAFNTNNASKENTRMDSQKEIQLSVSPVKKGRRLMEQDGEDNDDGGKPTFQIKASALKFDDDVQSPMAGPLPNNFQSFNIDKEERARRTEEKGSVSPQKKKRRAFANVMSSDEENNNDRSHFQVGQGLKLNLHDADQDGNNFSRNNSKQFECTQGTIKTNTQHLNDGTGSSISYQGDGEKIILLGKQDREDSTEPIHVRDGRSRPLRPTSNVYSPKDANGKQIPSNQIRLQFNTDGNGAQGSGPPVQISNGVREYQQKIKAYTKENYKYRQREEGRSVDEKLKTKALLKNIEKILNQGILGKNAKKDEDGNTIGGSQPQPSRQLPPQVPKTTTAAAYESSSKHQVINVKRQNKRASSIDECVVQLQIQNNHAHYQNQKNNRPPNERQDQQQPQFKETFNYNNEQAQTILSQQIPSATSTQIYNTFNNQQQNFNQGIQAELFYQNAAAQQHQLNIPLHFDVYNNHMLQNNMKTSIEQETSLGNRLTSMPDDESLNQSKMMLSHQQQMRLNESQQSSNLGRPPLHNQGVIQSEKKFERLVEPSENFAMQEPQKQNYFQGQRPSMTGGKQVLSESPNRDRIYNQMGSFIDPRMDNNYQLYPGNQLSMQTFRFDQANPPDGIKQQQFDSKSPKKSQQNGPDKIKISQEGISNTSNSDQAHFRTAPQRARNTFKRYHDGSRGNTSGTNTAQGYRTRYLNRIYEDSKSQTAEQSFNDQTPYKARPNHRRPSNQRHIGSGPNAIKHANTVKPYMQRRVTQSEHQQQMTHDQQQQQQQFQNMRQDPINFTNQYNIYCHLNDFQKYPWRYNPLINQHQQYMTSPPTMTSTQQQTNLTDQSTGNNSAHSQQPPGSQQSFMSTGNIANPMHNQYMNYMSQPENLLEFEQQINLLKLQSQISMIQQQQLSQQLAALGIMPGLALPNNPLLAGSNSSLMQISPAATQLRNFNQHLQTQTMLGGMPGMGHPQQHLSQDAMFQHLQAHSQSMSPPKKYRGAHPKPGQHQFPSTLRGPSPYDSLANQSNIAQVNMSYDNGGDSGSLNQNSGTNFTRNSGSRRSHGNSLLPGESGDSKQGSEMMQQKNEIKEPMPDQVQMNNYMNNQNSNGDSQSIEGSQQIPQISNKQVLNQASNELLKINIQ